MPVWEIKKLIIPPEIQNKGLVDDAQQQTEATRKHVRPEIFLLFVHVHISNFLPSCVGCNSSHICLCSTPVTGSFE